MADFDVTLTKDIDISVSDAYDELSSEDQKKFLEEKFSDLEEDNLTEVIDDMYEYLDEKNQVEFIMDKLNDMQGKTGIRERVRDMFDFD